MRAELLMSHEPRPRQQLLRNVVLFARLLRNAGIEVTPDQVVALVGALDHIDLRSRADFKSSTMALLVSRRDQLALFDRAFDLFWQSWFEEIGVSSSPAGLDESSPEHGEERDRLRPGAASDRELPDQPGTAEPEALVAFTYSDVETLRHKDFAALSLEELAAVRRILASLRLDLRRRVTRRRVRAGRGPFVDMRRAWRDNMRYGGEPLRLAWRRPKYKRRPLVVLCDISGSMERYSRVLLQFVYAMSQGPDRVEAFAFGTRLTRITHRLRDSNVDAALDNAAGAVADWAGGTRIGESLKTFNYAWARRVLGQGAIVLIISDGWDRGDIPLLEIEMRRLQSCCQRLIWLNPLLGDPRYEPLARGIRAALPYVDDFLPVHNLESLERLGRLLETLSEQRPLRRQRAESA